jgi:2-(3-amino-3-carboxypropyl)histidine synthase
MRKLRGESVIKARKSLTAPQRVKVDVDVRERELQGNDGAGGWAVVLGTLGRQGSLSVLNVSCGISLPRVGGTLTLRVFFLVSPQPQTIKQSLPRSAHPPFLLLLSELSPQKLDLLPRSLLSTFVQTSCPRLSIDWGYAFSRPLLSPYEASVAVGRAKGWKGLEADSTEQGKETLSSYPMDFYSVSVAHERCYVPSAQLG